MKKMILVVVMLSMAMVFAACDGSNETGASTANNEEVPVAATYENNYDDEDVVEYEESDTEEEETIRGFTRGTWSGNVYTSNQLGLSFTKPDGWIIATDEEMAEIMGLGMDMIGGEFTPEMLEMAGLTTIHDLVVSNPDTGAMVQIIAERLVFPNNRMSAPDYIDVVAEMLMETMGWEVNTDFPNMRLGTYTWYVYGTAAEIMPGFNIYGRYLVDVRDGFALTIQIVYSEVSESAEEIIAMFN